jgi:hypothetical protein
MRRAEGGAKIFGVFRVKNHDFTPESAPAYALSVLLILKAFVYQDFSTAISNYYSCSHNSYNGSNHRKDRELSIYILNPRNESDWPFI